MKALPVHGLVGLLALAASVAVAQSTATPNTTVRTSTQSGNNYSTVEELLRGGNQVQLQGDIRKLGDNTIDVPTFRNLYNVESCMEGSTGPLATWVIPKPPFICMKGTYDYWEPAAIVEVSCQKGFSFLKPGFLGGGRNAQPAQCGTGPNWFFEARVWASNPKPYGDRTSTVGGNFWEQTGGAMCSGEGTTGAGQYPFGYGIKYSRIAGAMGGAPNGPGGSIEAYISDNDPTWFQQLNPSNAGASMQQAQAQVATPQQCQQGQTNVEACWGKSNVSNGWVTHPNRAVAAALVGYRAVLKAQNMNRVAKDLREGLRMSMDYPFVKTPSGYAQSMGAPAGGGGRHKGSDCFVPGDGGPWWFTSGRKGQNNPPALREPTRTTTAFADPGTYIFTYWVKTGCVVYNAQGICGNDSYTY